jgi:hypothetical protein
VWCDFAMDPTTSVHQISCKSREKVWRRPWQWLEKRSGKKSRAVRGCLSGMLGLGQIKKLETGEKQSQEHAPHFLCHQGDCSQRIHRDSPNSEFHKLLWLLLRLHKIMRRFCRELRRKGTGCCVTTKHRLTLPFSTGNFWRLSPPPTLKNSVIWVRARTIPTERPLLVGEVSANFCG